MATIGDKFSQLGTSIINLVGTRASRNMDNLTTVGRANIATLASGISQSAVGNICTSATNPAYSGTAWNALKVTGKFSGCIPAGKSATGVSVNSDVADVTATGNVGILASSLSYKSDGTTTVASPIKLTMFINASGTVIARRYVASYYAPTASADTVWYDLNNNLLKTWTGSAWAQPSPVVGFKIGEVTLSGEGISSVVFDKGLQLLDAGTVSRAFDSSTIPVGTVIAYMGTDIPSGFLLMDGRYLSKTTYAALYAVIGDSQTTTAKDGYFQIADMTDGRYLMGSTVAGTRIGVGLPNIRFEVHSGVNGLGGTITYSSGAAYRLFDNDNYSGINNGTMVNEGTWGFGVDASMYSSVYKDDYTKVTPPSMKCLFCIHY